ncbi:transmembrane protein 222-like [Pelomyxa schiedti]|nr:transmembrane protein 222-like [Pelomyxa schiedti]
MGDEREVDPKRDHYHFALWLIPFIGHTGIVTSAGEINDFLGLYINRSHTRTGFGPVLKYAVSNINCIYPLGHLSDPVATWDNAIVTASEEYSHTMHNLITNNCHHHVSRALNLIQFEGRSNWGPVSLVWYLAWHSKFVSWQRCAMAWGPFLFFVITILFIVILVETL